MKNKIQRNEFLKLTTLRSIGLYISSCHQNNKASDENKETGQQTQQNSDSSAGNITSSENVIFYQKKDAAYETLRGGFNKRIQKFPKIIAQCKNTQGVSEAMKYAKQHQLAVAIKSGGHCFEGFSSNNDGLVIDLSLLNKTTWLDDETIKIEPACKLHQLYDVILPKGKIIPAGSCGGVGVGGLTLGGGYGLFSRKYGLTCDSLQEITLVDALGTIHSSKNNPELLWACKGGANGNFGVVTELIFKTHTAPDHFTSHRFKVRNLNAASAKTLLEKWFQLTSNLPLSCFSAFVMNGKTLNVLLTDFENHPDTVQSFKTTLSPFADKITVGEPKPLAAALKNYYGIQYPIYFKNSSAGLYQDFSSIQPFIADVLQKVIDTPGMIYQVNTLGGNIHTAEFEQSSAYPHRALPYLSELQTYWENDAQSKHFETAFEEVQQIFKSNNIQTQYRNYPDIHFEDWQHLYYGKSYERLQSIKQKYDPENRIRHEQSVQTKKIS